MPTITLNDFDYDLPESLIAQHPASTRTASRLLHMTTQAELKDRLFTELPELLRANDLLIFNNTKVIKARLHGEKDTGGKVEVLIERILTNNQALAHIRASKSPKPGTQLKLADQFYVDVLGREEELFLLGFPDSVLGLLDRYGALPLPPYITHRPDDDDETRYQTVYATHPGAVAAPTAGLHFDESLLQTLAQRGVHSAYVTLHVGAGTFQPVRNDDLSTHIMHKEHYQVHADTVRAIAQAKDKGGRVIAVGTTSVRALESAAQQYFPLQPTESDTQLFITPGYEFKTIDALITNFHLPKSTLLMLISALAGMEPIQRAYAHAIAHHYRFFSYGDAMLIEKPLQQR